MGKYFAYIAAAKKIIESYNGMAPLLFHLKQYFAANKKHGSRDRKIISSLVYQYYRTASAFPQKSTDDKICYAQFLTADGNKELLEAVQPELAEHFHKTLEEKIALLNISTDQLFPFSQNLSLEINELDFVHSLLVQPDLFLRIRPGKAASVTDKLQRAGMVFQKDGDCIRLANGSKVSEIISLNKEAVIQDKNSQRVLDYVDELDVEMRPLQVWDCCAASGGKSILLQDKLGRSFALTVSDIRQNILVNLKQRLQQAGVEIAESLVIDLEKNFPPALKNKFDIIIADVPCTGSGTWARTPEQLYFFEEEKIAEYAAKQKAIATNAIKGLKSDGLYFYITCSVFKNENEDVVEELKALYNLRVLHQGYCKGYGDKADSLFVAVLVLS